MTGYVEIDRLALRGRHGVLPQEREVGNLFEISVGLSYDMAQAASTDDVAYALDYARVVDVIASEMAIPSALLENLVARIKDALIAEFPMIESGRIKVAKLVPPIPARMASVSVSCQW